MSRKTLIRIMHLCPKNRRMPFKYLQFLKYNISPETVFFENMFDNRVCLTLFII